VWRYILYWSKTAASCALRIISLDANFSMFLILLPKVCSTLAHSLAIMSISCSTTTSQNLLSLMTGNESWQSPWQTDRHTSIELLGNTSKEVPEKRLQSKQKDLQGRNRV
jgi:hypothetical protein